MTDFEAPELCDRVGRLVKLHILNERFTILEPQNPLINEFETRSTNFTYIHAVTKGRLTDSDFEMFDRVQHNDLAFSISHPEEHIISMVLFSLLFLMTRPVCFNLKERYRERFFAC